MPIITYAQEITLSHKLDRDERKHLGLHINFLILFEVCKHHSSDKSG